MSKDPYAASCNPPRRAKRPRSAADNAPSQTICKEATPNSSTGTAHPRLLLPKRATQPVIAPNSDVPSTSPVPPSTFEPTVPSSPSRRGRKPGNLSRSARETQRRLNHSIIEKARRTKINNALTTLKELVPPDYGKKPEAQGHESDEGDVDEEDGDEEYGGEKKKSRVKPTGKKEEKEREYKLEILVRTVAFMQDLLQRVAKLEQENQSCSGCGGSIEEIHTQQKSKVEPSTGPNPASPSQDLPGSDIARHPKRARIESRDQELTKPIHPTSLSSTPSQESNLVRHRLPSISSWLPATLLDPSIFNTSSPTRDPSRNTKEPVPPLQLPTPPSSTQFTPTAALAPSFTPSAGNTHQKVPSPALTRTPEDEHAATMLLQISGGSAKSSPTFRPLPPSIISLTEPISSAAPALSSTAAPKLDSASMHDKGNREGISVQTPASILGLITLPAR